MTGGKLLLLAPRATARLLDTSPG